MHRYIEKLPYLGDPRWISFDPFCLKSLPPFACCYVLIVDGEAMYIGQTLNLRNRFYAHKVHRAFSGRNVVLKAKFGQKFGDWAMRECRLIERLRPALNIKGV